MGQETCTRCEVCSTAFEPRFRFQLREEAGRVRAFCSQRCHQSTLETRDACVCSMCGNGFELEFPFQVSTAAGDRRYFCTTACRDLCAKPKSVQPRRIAIFNHKGGTGKTTTAVNLAAGLAETGKRVLLVDVDGQGNVGASLGIRGEQTLYHVIVNGVRAEDAAVPVRANLDVLTSNELLAAAELYLATRPNRDRVLRERLALRATLPSLRNHPDENRTYDVIVLDCAPALSLMNQNALVFADSVVVPVSCDYLSLVGVKQVLRTLKHVRDLLAHPVELLGVVPTFYDVRNKISREVLDVLTENFGDRCLPPVRVNTRLREAPSAKQTIFEFAPESHGAYDYAQLVQCVMNGAFKDAIPSETVPFEAKLRQRTTKPQPAPAPLASGFEEMRAIHDAPEVTSVGAVASAHAVAAAS